MRRSTSFASLFLLVVFGLGGLISPMVHRVVHDHDVEHRHGAAAAQVLAAAADLSGVNFFVEERTSPDELTCELCARLTLTAFDTGEVVEHALSITSFVLPGNASPDDTAARISRIRGPPFLI